MGTLKSPYLVLKFAQRTGKNALCNGVPSPHSEVCPSQSFVNIWQSGGQFLKDLCLWLRTFFKSKRLSLQVGRELIFPHCRKAYSRHGYELLDLRSENSILFSGISGFHPGGWDTVGGACSRCVKGSQTLFQIPKSLSIKPYRKGDVWGSQAACFGHLFHCYYFC